MKLMQNSSNITILKIQNLIPRKALEFEGKFKWRTQKSYISFFLDSWRNWVIEKTRIVLPRPPSNSCGEALTKFWLKMAVLIKLWLSLSYNPLTLIFFYLSSPILSFFLFFILSNQTRLIHASNLELRVYMINLLLFSLG